MKPLKNKQLDSGWVAAQLLDRVRQEVSGDIINKLFNDYPEDRDTALDITFKIL